MRQTVSTRRCLACDKTFAGSKPICPACGHTPVLISGFYAFAPELADCGAGLAADQHDRLNDTQQASFWFVERNRLIVDLLRRFFPQGRSLLEVGCGTGYVLYGIRRGLANVTLTGGEIGVAGLVHAHKRLGAEVELIQADARRIPFAGAFDVVAAFDVLEHIAEDEKALAEMRDAVRPGGGLLLSVPQHPFLWSETDKIAMHERRYKRRELADKVARAGMEIVFQTSFVTTLFPLMVWQRLLRARHKGYDAARELALPRWLDGAFGFALRIERALIRSGLRLPFGGSRFVVARRRN